MTIPPRLYLFLLAISTFLFQLSPSLFSISSTGTPQGPKTIKAYRLASSIHPTHLDTWFFFVSADASCCFYLTLPYPFLLLIDIVGSLLDAAAFWVSAHHNISRPSWFIRLVAFLCPSLHVMTNCNYNYVLGSTTTQLLIDECMICYILIHLSVCLSFTSSSVNLA